MGKGLRSGSFACKGVEPEPIGREPQGANDGRPGGRPLVVGEALRDVGAQGAQNI